MNDRPELPSIERETTPSMRAVILGSLVAAILGLLLFAWLADEVFEGGARRFDETVRGAVHQYACPWLTSTMVAISALGSEVLVAVFIVAFIVFLKMKWRRAAIWLAMTMAGGMLLQVALKFSFQRTRPEAFFGTLPHSYSFPSGHSLMSFCIYGVLAGLVTARIRSGAIRVVIWTAAAVLVAAIGLSRIYLGVHYPSDVVAGYLAAAVWVSTLITADRYRKHKRLRAAEK